MSLDATQWAWRLAIRPSQKLVLLSLADRADEHHRCWHIREYKKKFP